MIVFAGSSTAGDMLNISDSVGSNWTALNPATSQSGGTARSWYAFSAGTSRVKISVTSNARWEDILFDEFSGVTQTRPLDKVGQKTGSGTSTSAALVPSTNNELIWAGSLGTITGVGPGYGKGADDSTQNWTEHKILSGGSGTTQTATFANSGGYICLAASFKPAVSAGTPPAISAFTASPSTINAGQSSTLTWTSSGGTSATLNGTSVAVSGNRVVSPSQITTYTLVVTNAAGSDSAQAKVTVNTASGSSSASQKMSFWPTSMVPGTPEVTNDTSPVTLGLKFHSDVPGSVTGVRFYKGSYNTGTHVGNLWTSSGTKLASVTFTGETASGWQQANFSSPVSIAANTTYVISYLAPKGYYADDQSYSWASVNATPLHVSGSSPGVFSYGSSASFPNGVWNASNYWVDLVFVPSGSSSTPPSTYSISGKVSGSAATLTLSGAASGQTKTDATGNYSFSGLANGSYLVAPSQSGYSFSPSTAAKTVNGANISGVNFTASAIPPPVQHTVSLSWAASTSPNISGYNVYRATEAGGPYTKINASLDAGTSYADKAVSSGGTYYYVTTAVNSSNVESGYSNQAEAAVPRP